MEESKFKCIKCNYNTSCASDWIKHAETAKHKRNGHQRQGTSETKDNHYKRVLKNDRL
jgi:hypothetical protein